MFDQPELEQILLDNLAAHPLATLRRGCQVTSIDGTGPVTVHYTQDGAGHQITADAQLGADGTNSLVRQAIGSGLRDLRFAERWLVIDVRSPRALCDWGGVYQICDPARAATRTSAPLRPDDGTNGLLSELGTYLGARGECHGCVLPAVRDANARITLNGAQVQLVVGHAAEHLLHHDPPDHAPEVGAEATVDAQAEGRMPVRRAVELDLLRLVEHLGGQVGGSP